MEWINSSSRNINSTQSYEDYDANTTDSGSVLGGLVSESFRDVFILINYIFLMGIISFMGIIFNAINIIIFAKQGLNDTVNITLLGLAVADLFSTAAHFWQSMCYSLWFFGSFTSINFKHLQYITASWPSGMFGRVSSWLTVLISFERCICVVMPLHVKGIITPNRVIVANIVIYIAMIAINIPVFYSVGLKTYFFPQYNRTMLGFYYRKDGIKIEQICLALLGTSQMISFALIVLFTAILSAKLNQKRKWRQSVSSRPSGSGSGGTNQSDNVSSKDKKVSKMVVAICLLFVCLLSPYWFSGMAMSIFPEYNNLGRYRNIFVAVFSVVLTLESLCSTINIFIYYNMSSKYSATFRQLFWCCFRKNDKDSTNTNSTNTDTR